ncbi:MAG: hypothetical protein AAFU67_04175, partial [Bacteroidota bacterium]
MNKRMVGLLNGVKEIRRFGWVIMLLLGATLTIGAINSQKGKLLEGVTTTVAPLAGGEHLLTELEVREELEKSFTKPLESLFLSEIDVERVEDILKRHPLVADAEAYIDGDLVLHVSVTQRNPLLRVISNNGQNYYLDENGIRMPLSD